MVILIMFGGGTYRGRRRKMEAAFRSGRRKSRKRRKSPRNQTEDSCSTQMEQEQERFDGGENLECILCIPSILPLASYSNANPSLQFKSGGLSSHYDWEQPFRKLA